MKKTSIIAFIIGSIAVIGGIVWMVRSSAPGGSSGADGAADPERWAKGAPVASTTVKIVEFSDFQCPACGAYYPILKKLTEEYGDRITFIYRHFPLRRIHRNADASAAAAEAAGLQGKFWEMHNMIFDNQKSWSEERNPDDIFAGYANAIGLDKERFLADYESEAVADRIDADYEDGLALRVNSTPTFFVNGVKIQNPRGYDAFKALIDAELSGASK